MHESAPGIAESGIAHPIAQTWTAAMVLKHFGEQETTRVVVASIEERVVDSALVTRD